MSKYQPIFDRYNAKLEPLLANPHNVHVLEVIPYHGTNGINTIVKLAIDRGINADGVVNTSMPASERMYERNVEIQRLSLGNVITVEIQAALIAALDKIVNKTLVNGRLDSTGVQAVVTDAAVRDLIMFVESDVDFAFVDDENIVAVMVAKNNSLGFVGSLTLAKASEPEEPVDPNDGLPWITAQTELVVTSLEFEKGGVVGSDNFNLSVGDKVIVHYTNANTERMRATLGVMYGLDELQTSGLAEHVIEVGSGTIEYVIQTAGGFILGDNFGTLKFGGEDGNPIWHIASLTVFVDPQYATTNHTLFVSSATSPSAPIFAAKAGDSLAVVGTYNVDVQKYRVALRNSNPDLSAWDWEDLVYQPYYLSAPMTLPAPEFPALALHHVVIASEDYQILAEYPIRIMNADVDESTLTLTTSGAFSDVIPNTFDFVAANALTDWSLLRVLRSDGTPLSALQPTDAMPRVIAFAIDPSDWVLEQRIPSNPDDAGGVELLLVGGLIPEAHRSVTVTGWTGAWSDVEAFKLQRKIYVMPETMSLQVQDELQATSNPFSAYSAETPLQIPYDATSIQLTPNFMPEGWEPLNGVTYTIAGSDGEGVSIDNGQGRIVLTGVDKGIPTSVNIKMLPEGIDNFNAITQTLYFQRNDAE